MSAKSRIKVTLVIPTYNEGVRLTKVVAVAKRCELIDEIVVVDDGCNLKSQKVIDSLSGIQVVRHKTNMGKTRALESGLRRANHPIIFLIDSDLQGLSESHLETMIRHYLTGSWDMILGERGNEGKLNQWIGVSIAWTGERIMTKNFLDDHPELFQVEGYLFEPALNRTMINNLKVAKVKLVSLGQVYKVQKYGLRGWLDDVKMHSRYIKILGLSQYFLQCRWALGLPTLTIVK